MSKVGKRLIQGLREAVSLSKGEATGKVRVIHVKKLPQDDPVTAQVKKNISKVLLGADPLSVPRFKYHERIDTAPWDDACVLDFGEFTVTTSTAIKTEFDKWWKKHNKNLNKQVSIQRSFPTGVGCNITISIKSLKGKEYSFNLTEYHWW